jgi:hypothetical protein
MKNSSFVFYKSDTVFEIMSGIEDDIYFEIEILCEGTKDILAQLRDKQADVLANTYMHQCLFLIEEVLNYIRNDKKTTVHFVGSADESTCDVCCAIHQKEVSTAQLKIKNVIDRFKESVSFIYPSGFYPNYLFSLKTKMTFIDIFMLDLFHLEKTQLIPTPVALPYALEFEGNLMN